MPYKEEMLSKFFGEIVGNYDYMILDYLVSIEDYMMNSTDFADKY